MVLNTDRIKAITIDSFGTVVDVHSRLDVLENYVDDPEKVSKTWRRQTGMYRILSNSFGYQSHSNLNAQGLQYALDYYGRSDIEFETIQKIAEEIYHNLDPFDDVKEGLDRIVDADIDVYVVSNGDPDVLESMVENAGIKDTISEAISSEEVQVCKPHTKLYKNAAERIDTRPDNLAHVSYGWMDVHGAMYAGMQGVWMNRPNAPAGLDPYGVRNEPDLTVDDFMHLADSICER